VLDALLGEAERGGAIVLPDHRVTGVQRAGGEFRVITSRGEVRADAVVLATGGLALPKSGSDGAGFEFARALGHTIVPTTPAPLHRWREDDGLLAGSLRRWSWRGGWRRRALGGSLWTHMSAVRRRRLATLAAGAAEGRTVRLTVNFRPGLLRRCGALW
jgi:glycine/D-amino acid oxidase-like deaminating enzyme